jgi:hypothetical protein
MTFVITRREMLTFAAGDLREYGVMARPPAAGYPAVV